MNFFLRIGNRLRWITKVCSHLTAGYGDRIRLFLGGIWLLLNDSGKSTLRLKSEIIYNGQSCIFEFRDVGDFGLLYEIFLADNYSLPKAEQVNVIFDIGANIGISTMFFRMCYPKATIHSFEPDPNNLSRLRSLAKELGNVHVHEFALWHEETQLTFFADPHRGSSSSTQRIRDRQEKIEVNSITLDTILNNYGKNGVDILKIDIEGAEENVLSSWKSTIPVNFMIGEIHGDLCNHEVVFEILERKYSNFSKTPFNDGKRFYFTAE